MTEPTAIERAQEQTIAELRAENERLNARIIDLAGQLDACWGVHGYTRPV
jgi:cell division protein FtsB